MKSNKRIVSVLALLCITAILWVALCGCDDLGVYEDPEEYFDTFGDIVLISGTSKKQKEYSVEDYFYNEDSRDDFFKNDDGTYGGVERSDYVYMAIPFEKTIEMDTLALYLHSEDDVSVYISIYITDYIPSNFRGPEDIIPDDEDTSTNTETEIDTETDTDTEIETDTDTDTDTDTETDTDTDTETDTESEADKPDFDDPDPKTKIGDLVVNLKADKWNSFMLDEFTLNGTKSKSIQVKDGQYVLIQFRNNSGVRVFNEINQIYVDPQTGLELPKAELKMTNLLIRALNIENESKEQGGE